MAYAKKGSPEAVVQAAKELVESQQVAMGQTFAWYVHDVLWCHFCATNVEIADMLGQPRHTEDCPAGKLEKALADYSKKAEKPTGPVPAEPPGAPV